MREGFCHDCFDQLACGLEWDDFLVVVLLVLVGLVLPGRLDLANCRLEPFEQTRRMANDCANIHYAHMDWYMNLPNIAIQIVGCVRNRHVWYMK